MARKRNETVVETAEAVEKPTRTIRKAGQPFGKVLSTSIVLAALGTLGITVEAFTTAYDAVPRTHGVQGPRGFNAKEANAFAAFRASGDFGALVEALGSESRAAKLLGRAGRLGLLS